MWHDIVRTKFHEEWYRHSNNTKVVCLNNLRACSVGITNGKDLQCGILNISQPYRPPRPVTGWLYFYFTLRTPLRWSHVACHYIPGFMKTGSDIQISWGGGGGYGQAHRYQDNFVGFFFPPKI
jgi:hypothetical protein